MTDWLRNLLSRIWYKRGEVEERDARTRRVHERAEKAKIEADNLIESYAAADRAIRKHRKVWHNQIGV